MPIICLIAIFVRFTSVGPILHWSSRVGRNNKLFKMPKFRSMIVCTPQVATHLFTSVSSYLTPIGSFLRATSLDELPQLWSILVGDMAFVGPRPALFNQYDLVELRTRNGLEGLTPGITGWAQINGRDEIDIISKVALEIEYFKKRSLWFDLKILSITFFKVIQRTNIAH